MLNLFGKVRLVKVFKVAITRTAIMLKHFPRGPLKLTCANEEPFIFLLQNFLLHKL